MASARASVSPKSENHESEPSPHPNELAHRSCRTRWCLSPRGRRDVGCPPSPRPGLCGEAAARRPARGCSCPAQPRRPAPPLPGVISRAPPPRRRLPPPAGHVGLASGTQRRSRSWVAAAAPATSLPALGCSEQTWGGGFSAARKVGEARAGG